MVTLDRRNSEFDGKVDKTFSIKAVTSFGEAVYKDIWQKAPCTEKTLTAPGDPYEFKAVKGGTDKLKSTNSVKTDFDNSDADSCPFTKVSLTNSNGDPFDGDYASLDENDYIEIDVAKWDGSAKEFIVSVETEKDTKT